jgi:hypothetical protein|tara:strand:+ start:340 stop:480 length:141 start_codon:yes stop_codon:yes gene_type:complete
MIIKINTNMRKNEIIKFNKYFLFEKNWKNKNKLLENKIEMKGKKII